MNTKLTIIAITVATLGLGACTQEQRVMETPPGKYVSKTSSTDANGTTTDTKSVTDVSVDQYGHKTAVVKNKTTKDPKGLFNKTTTNDSTQVIETK